MEAPIYSEALTSHDGERVTNRAALLNQVGRVVEGGEAFEHADHIKKRVMQVCCGLSLATRPYQGDLCSQLLQAVEVLERSLDSIDQDVAGHFIYDAGYAFFRDQQDCRVTGQPLWTRFPVQMRTEPPEVSFECQGPSTPLCLFMDRLSPEMQEKVQGRMMVTALCMAIGLAPEKAIADHNAHLNEISRRDSLSLDDVVGLRAMAGNWTMEYTEGWSAGFAEGRATAILRILQSRGIEVTGNTWERVTACSDLATLIRWLNLGLSVTHAEGLFAEASEPA